MTEKIATYANKGTPKDVSVSPNASSLLTWATGKFGMGVVFLVALVVVWSDLKDTRSTTETLLRDTIKANLQMSSSNREMSHALQQMSDTLHRLESRMQ